MDGHDATLKRIPKKSSLVEDVINVLSNFILEGLIEGTTHTGDRLPSERELSEKLGVGRSTLREAIKVLTMLGLLEVRTGQGTFVTDGASDFYSAPLAWGLIIGEKSITELIEARSLLDCEAAYFAALRATREELQELEQAFTGMQSAARDNDPVRFTEFDVKFHMVIAQSAHNAVIYQTIRTIRKLLELWIQKVLVDTESLSATLAEHEKVYQCVMDGDADGAKEAMHHHVVRAAERLTRVLKTKPSV